MDIQELVRQLHTKNDSKIVMLVADGLGGLPLTPDGKTELETAQTPNLDQLAKRRRARCQHPGAARHHARAVVRDTWAVRLRSAEIPDRSRGPGGDWRRYRIAARRRRGAVQFLHAGRRRKHHGPTSRPDSHRRERSAGHLACARSRSLASRLSSNRSRSIGSWWSFGRRLGGTRGRHRSAGDRRPPLEPVADDPASEKTAEVANEFLRQAREMLAGQPKANFLTMRGFAGQAGSALL